MYHSPLKIYEYLAMATPVIASAFADARRATGDGATGWLFAPGDRAGLVDALRRAHAAYSAGDVLPRMGRRARETVVAEHGWPARVETLLARARRLLPGRLPPERAR
jgi:glycosyltransferase involved in cell wall biosynthesis